MTTLFKFFYWALFGWIQWCVNLFIAAFNAIIDFLGWLVTSIYNLLVDFFVFLWDGLLSAAIYLLELLPNVDYSRHQSKFEDYLRLVLQLNSILPVVEIFSFFVLLLSFYFVIFVIRTVVKFIPTVG